MWTPVIVPTATAPRPERPCRGGGNDHGISGRDSVGAARHPLPVDEVRAHELVRQLALLAGREIDDVEVAAVVHRSRGMSAAVANRIWHEHRRAPRTVALRDYLAMTLMFVEGGR
jgi:hypothetical protein